MKGRRGIRPISFCAELFVGTNLHAAGEFRDFGDVMARAPVGEARADVLDGSRVSIACGADLDGGGSGEEKFDGIFRGGDAAHADDGDFDGLGCFPDHAYGDGFDGRA